LFEINIALKYLVPRKKSWSTALISGLSVLVISLVVWLVLVFLSVTSGIERNWLHRLTSLHAPIRLSPTETYYHSYFYQIDTLAAASRYTYKTIGEKRESPLSDPYRPDSDPELPTLFPPNYHNDPVKELFAALTELKQEIPDLTFQDYEMGGALFRLTLKTSASLSQMTYLLSIPDQNPSLPTLLETPLSDSSLPGLPIYLPKNYRDNGAQIGDRGTLQFTAATGASSQEQKIDVRVAGFYDPGVMAMGSKCLLVPKEVTRAIHAVTQTFSPDGTPTNGIFVWLSDIAQTEQTSAKLSQLLEKKGLAPYWKLTTYKEFEFAKDLLQQFQSDKTLLLLVASIILIVACSNIISLLVLLVSDKKKEIAILQSMGARPKSIATIFGLCGTLIGLLSCLLGTSLALLTLRHLDTLVSLLSKLQGRSAFNPAFFGKSLPNQLSWEALLFVLLTAPLLSLAAGLIPALKASRIQPATVLRNE